MDLPPDGDYSPHQVHASAGAVPIPSRVDPSFYCAAISEPQSGHVGLERAWSSRGDVSLSSDTSFPNTDT